MPRLKQRYEDEIRAALKDELELDSIMQRAEGDEDHAQHGRRRREDGREGDGRGDRGAVDDRRPARPDPRARRKSIASFKLREGMAVGARVTLRGARMYEFLDRLVSIALPRIRDFRGLNPDSFDGRGNYSLGIKEQIIFPEIDYDSVASIRGLDIAITTTAETDEQARALLRHLGHAVRHREQKGLAHGQDLTPRQAEADAEVQDAGVHAVQPAAAGRAPSTGSSSAGSACAQLATRRYPGHDKSSW